MKKWNPEKLIVAALVATIVGASGPPDTQTQAQAAPQEEIQQAVGYGGSDGQESLEKNPWLKVETFTTKDGREGWKIRLERQLPVATPAVSDGVVYVGGGFGSYEFYALDAKTGKPLWLFHCGDDGPTAAVVEAGRVAFNTESCILYVLDSRTGEKIWGKWLGDPLMSQPAVADGRIYMAYPNKRGGHSLSCMSLENGEEFWTQEIPGEVITAPIISDGAVYATTLEGSVHSFDLKTGEKRYSEQLYATSAPWIYKGEVYVSLREDEKRTVGGKEVVVRNEGQGRITKTGERFNKDLWAKQQADYLNLDVSSDYATKQAAMDAAVGFGGAGPSTAKLYQSSENLGVASVSGVWAYQGSRPTIIGDRNYTSMGDTLKVLDPENGKVIWSKPVKVKDNPGGRPFTPPAYAGGKLYIGTVTGEIICMDAKDGRELWRYDCGEPIRFQPAVSGGKVFWGTDLGSVYCIDARDPNADGWNMWGGNAQHNGLVK